MCYSRVPALATPGPGAGLRCASRLLARAAPPRTLVLTYPVLQPRAHCCPLPLKDEPSVSACSSLTGRIRYPRPSRAAPLRRSCCPAQVDYVARAGSQPAHCTYRRPSPASAKKRLHTARRCLPRSQYSAAPTGCSACVNRPWRLPPRNIMMLPGVDGSLIGNAAPRATPPLCC